MQHILKSRTENEFEGCCLKFNHNTNLPQWILIVPLPFWTIYQLTKCLWTLEGKQENLRRTHTEPPECPRTEPTTFFLHHVVTQNMANNRSQWFQHHLLGFPSIDEQMWLTSHNTASTLRNRTRKGKNKEIPLQLMSLTCLWVRAQHRSSKHINVFNPYTPHPHPTLLSRYSVDTREIGCLRLEVPESIRNCVLSTIRWDCNCLSPVRVKIIFVFVCKSCTE